MALAPGDNATLFSAGAASTLRLIVYLAAAIVLMILDHRGHYLQAVRGHASLLIGQVISRGDQALVRASVRVACLVASSFRPRPLPEWLAVENP